MRSVWCIFLLLIAWQFLGVSTQAQPANHVLVLDGDGDYVELPSNIFNHLEDSTIEAWIRWDSFRVYSQPLGFGNGEFWQVLGINNWAREHHLQFFIYDNVKLALISVDSILLERRWHHVAAVCGRRGMQLYLDGILVGENPDTSSFATIKNGDYGYFGKAHWSGNADFHGQMDEIRVWRTARTGEQIRRAMFSELAGDEPGLVSLWNFSAGDASDIVGGHDGVFHGDARCIPASLPDADTHLRPAMVSGVVRDASGQPLSKADVQIVQDGEKVAVARTGHEGDYRLTLYPSTRPYDLSATWNTLGDWNIGLKLESGQRKVLDWVLQPAVNIQGTLRTYGDSVHAGVHV